MSDSVADAIVDVSDSVIMPHFQALAESEIFEKGPGDLVTVADRESEVELAARLLDLEPGSVVVGEEAVAADPDVLLHAADKGKVWLIDPIDGTSAFAKGADRFAVMVALLEDGQTVKSWIWQPTTKRMFTAELGNGAFVNSARLATAPPLPETDLRGDVRIKHFDEVARARLKARSRTMPGVAIEAGGAVGYVYPELAEGELDFAIFGRQYPWDHAPGSLLLQESGGRALTLEGGAYDPTRTTWGLLSTGPDVDWEVVRSLLLDETGE